MHSSLAVAKADPQSVNTTSLRLLKLLRWLMEAPCSFATLQQLFLEDMDTQKALSEDTLGLYLNTLRQMGCHIQRPVKANQHRYTLASHPFKPVMDDDTLKALALWKRRVSLALAPLAVVELDAALANLIGEEAMQTVFLLSRTLDYRPHYAIIQQLKALCSLLKPFESSDNALFQYHSPKQGITTFPFSFSQFLYEKGVLYAVGVRGDKLGASRLRVERILSVEPLFESSITTKATCALESTMANATSVIPVVCYLSVDASQSSHNWQHRLAPWRDCLAGEATVSSVAPQWLLWQGEVTDCFLLKQHLLQWPGTVQVVSPHGFAQEWTEHLAAMALLYASTPETNASHHPQLQAAR